jgi:glycosyltransferase involved in cell wall biosynthesis
MKQSAVTVIMPVRNGELFLHSAIQSVLQQTFQDFELWVLDNGSVDRTVEIAKSFTDPRIRIFELGAIKMGGAIQYAIENASSPWLARMDADDLMFPDRLKKQMAFIEAHPNAVLVGTAYGLLTPFGHIFERFIHPPRQTRQLNKQLLHEGRFFANPSTFFRREAALKSGGFDMKFPNDDLALWFRLLEQGEGWEMAECLHLYRLRFNSTSRNEEHKNEKLQIRAEYFPDKPVNAANLNPQSFWRKLTTFELTTGDSQALLRTVENMENELASFEDPNYIKKMRGIAWFMKLRSLFGPLAGAYYHWTKRKLFRRRKDWESFFASYGLKTTTEHVKIRPSQKWVGLQLKDVWEYRELLWFLVWRDVKVRYKQTALGAAWAVIQPLMTMVVFSVFFGNLAKIPSDGIPYPIFAYAALVPWTFFANALTQSSNSLVGSANLF